MAFSQCWECGGGIDTVVGPVKSEVRGEAITVPDIEHQVCRSCGEQFYDGETINKFERIAVAMYRNKHGFLSPEQIKDLRIDLGLTQERFAEALGVSKRMPVRWEKGTVYPNATTDMLLTAIRDAYQGGFLDKAFPRVAEAIAPPKSRKASKRNTPSQVSREPAPA